MNDRIFIKYKYTGTLQPGDVVELYDDGVPYVYEGQEGLVTTTALCANNMDNLPIYDSCSEFLSANNRQDEIVRYNYQTKDYNTVNVPVSGYDRIYINPFDEIKSGEVICVNGRSFVKTGSVGSATHVLSARPMTCELSGTMHDVIDTEFAGALNPGSEDPDPTPTSTPSITPTITPSVTPSIPVAACTDWSTCGQRTTALEVDFVDANNYDGDTIKSTIGDDVSVSNAVSHYVTGQGIDTSSGVSMTIPAFKPTNCRLTIEYTPTSHSGIQRVMGSLTSGFTRPYFLEINLDFRGRTSDGIQLYCKLPFGPNLYHTGMLFCPQDNNGDQTPQAFKDAFALNQTHTIVLEHVVGNPDLCKCWLNGTMLPPRTNSRAQCPDEVSQSYVGYTSTDMTYNALLFGSWLGQPSLGIYKSLKVEDCESAAPTPSTTPSITPTITPSITPTITPTLTPSITPTITPTPTPTPVEALPVGLIGSCIDGEAAGDRGGVSTSINAVGDRIAIGATKNDAAGNNAGHTRIFSWNGSTWTQMGADIDGEAVSDEFGYSVSLNDVGDRVAIGAIYNDGNGSNAGHVRIYSWDDTAWTQLGADIDGEAEFDYSGRDVSLNAAGDRVAISAYNNDDAGADAGHVRIYSWSGTAWTQLGADIDGEAAEDYSGSSVRLNSTGDRVVIGSPGSWPDGDTGYTRIYQWTGTTWSQIGADIVGEASGDQSGCSVSINATGDRVAVGASRNDGTGSLAGHTRMYQLNNGTWTQMGADIDGEAAEDYSGISVSLNDAGDRVAIGAWGNDGTANRSGHVRIFEWTGTSWAQIDQDIDGEVFDTRIGDRNTTHLNATGDRVVIGSWNANGQTGRTCVHKLTSPTAPPKWNDSSPWNDNDTWEDNG